MVRAAQPSGLPSGCCGPHPPALPVSHERLKEEDADVGKYDKVYALRIDADARGYVLTAREYDLRTRAWGLPLEKTVPQREEIPYAAWDAIQGTFAPVIRVDKERGLLLVKGAVPGADGGHIVVRPSAKTPAKKGA